MKKHFVAFLSPGSFMDEETIQPIDGWDVGEATKRAADIKERHGATPFGFSFLTRARTDDDLDSKVIKTSGIYFLGGKVFTLAEVIARNDPKDRVLISNMKGNGFDKIIENTNSWKVTKPFTENDVLLGKVSA